MILLALLLGGSLSAAGGYYGRDYISGDKAEIERLAAQLESVNATLEALQSEDAAIRTLAEGNAGDLELLMAVEPPQPVDTSAYMDLALKVAERVTRLEVEMESFTPPAASAARGGASLLPVMPDSGQEEKIRELIEQARSEIALLVLQGAVEGGYPYESQAEFYSSLVKRALPRQILEESRRGVKTLPELQRAFPEAARIAVREGLKSGAGSGEGFRIMDFARYVLGARSLEPRPGSGADAVLSRAEDQLRRGNLAGAVDILRQLPKAARDSMGFWIEDAQARIRVLGALAKLRGQA